MPVDLRERPAFPDLVDNTMRSDFIMCPTKWMYSFLFSLAGAAPSVHLHAGGAFAKGLEVARRSFYEEGKPEGEAKKDGLRALMQAYGDFIPVPTKSGDKSLENVIKAYDSYLTRYRLPVDLIKPVKLPSGRAMVEFTWTVQSEVTNPSTGNPILIGGRADMIGEMYGDIWVTDEKTTGQLGEQWANQFELDSQFPGYTYAARKHGFPAVGAVVRGIGLLKTKISHGEVIIQYNDWQLERWFRQFNRDLRRMVAAWEQFPDMDMALSKNACNAYGGCTFLPLCRSAEPAQWLNQYRLRRWDPLAKDFGEKLLEQPRSNPNDPLEIDLKELM